MQIITETALLKRIDVFLERHEMAPTTFGRQATGEPQLITSIRNGRSPSLKVVNRLIEFMDQKDEEAATQAKLHAPLDAPAADEEAADEPLPFGSAPEATRPGATSPTSSPTPEPRPSCEERTSNRCSAGTAE
jgi:hypothetical protein